MNDYMKIVDQNSGIDKFKLVGIALIRHINITLALFMYFVTQRAEKDEIIKYGKGFLYFTMCLKYIKPPLEKILVLDQGIVQLYWSLAGVGSRDSSKNIWLKRLIKNTEKIFDYRVGYLVLDPLKASQRAGQRKSAIVYDSMDSEMRNQLYIKRKKDFEMIIKDLNDDKIVIISESNGSDQLMHLIMSVTNSKDNY